MAGPSRIAAGHSTSLLDLYDDTLLYDLVHGPFASGEILQFFIDAAAEFGPSLLELACGTGNILIPLTKAGVDVFGLDISDRMLSACRRKAAEQNVAINVRKGDMRSFRVGRKFGLIYIAGNSFQHLYTGTDVSECLECVKIHLEAGGRLIVEIYNPYVPLLGREMGKRFVVGAFGDYVLTEDVNYDAALQLSEFHWHFWHRPSDREKTLSFMMRQFFPQEFESLFELHGFTMEQKFGDFDRSGFESSSASQIVIASLK